MTYYSANHYSIKAEKSANLAEHYANQASSFSGRIIQLGFDGTLENDTLVFKHSPAGVDTPYDLLDDYEYELDLAYLSTESLPSSTKIVIENGTDTINFVSALHRDSATPVTVNEMKQVMRFNDATGYRWLFKAAFKITPAEQKVFLLYPVISLASSGLEIGDIGIAPFGIDESLNLRRYLNGQVISQSQFQSFTTKIKRAVELFPNLSATEENWQAEVTNSKLGQCGKFVIDDEAGTIRLPKAVNINSLQDLALIGGIKAESLPNISGVIPNVWKVNEDPTGAFFIEGNGISNAPSLGSSNSKNVKLDASRSSSTYQDNAPVQQEAIQYPYFIQVATGVEETLPAISEYKLNNPNFFGQSMWTDVTPNNASWLLSNGAFHSGATYGDYYEWLLEQRNANLKTVYLWKSTIDEQIMFATETDTLSVGTTIYGYMPTVIVGEIVGISGNDVTIRNDVTNQVYTQSIDVANPIASSSYLYDRSKINVISKTELDYWTYPNNTSDYDFVINTADQTFRLPLLDGSESILSNRFVDIENTTADSAHTAPANGFFYCRAIVSQAGGYAFVRKSETDFRYTAQSYTANTTQAGFLPVAKGDVVYLSRNGANVTYFRFIYAKGNGSLYFYVGDTLKDAQVINAGGVLNDVAELKEHAIVETYRNGTEWYRVYADGWCEQGGIIDIPSFSISKILTINLLKPYINTDYSVFTQLKDGANMWANVQGANVDVFTTSSFNLYLYEVASTASVDAHKRIWEAKGYIR